MGEQTTTEQGSGAGRVSRGARPPEWLLSVVNPVLKRLLRSRLHGIVSDHLLLLTVTGRHSGTEYTFPVGYERDGNTVYVTSHGTNWWKNLRGGGQEVEVVLRGEHHRGHATVTEDNESVAAYLHDRFKQEGVDIDRRVGLDIDGKHVPSEATLREVVDHVVLVEIDLRAA